MSTAAPITTGLAQADRPAATGAGRSSQRAPRQIQGRSSQRDHRASVPPDTATK
ncbi:MAG TPA: hypothetical protein VEU08_03685 [Vicinamibacterales bacterium]|nr:hypothetical protein [Vicinamibacterales bacterium]